MRHNLYRNLYKLKGDLAFKGFDSWYHFFCGISKSDNKMRRFGIEYSVVNPQIGDVLPILQEKEGIRPSYLKVTLMAFGNKPVVLSKYIGIKEIDICKDELSIDAKDMFLSENKIIGKLGYDDEKDYSEKADNYDNMAEWNIDVDKVMPYSTGANASYFPRLLDVHYNYWHAEGLVTYYKGFIKLNGEEFDIIPRSSEGYADKIWGSELPEKMILLNSSNCSSEKSGRRMMDTEFVARGLNVMGRMALCIMYHGIKYEFNGDKLFWNTRSRFASYESDDKVVWKAKLVNKRNVAELVISCPRSKMVNVDIDSPDGMEGLKNSLYGGDGIGYINLYEKKKKELVYLDKILIKDCLCMIGTMRG